MVFISNFDSMLLQAFQVKIIFIYFNGISDVLRTRYHTWMWKIWFLRLRACANTKCFTVTKGRYGRTSEMPFFMCIKPWHANEFDSKHKITLKFEHCFRYLNHKNWNKHLTKSWKNCYKRWYFFPWKWQNLPKNEVF